MYWLWHIHTYIVYIYIYTYILIGDHFYKFLCWQVYITHIKTFELWYISHNIYMCVKNCEDSRAFLKKKLSAKYDGWLEPIQTRPMTVLKRCLWLKVTYLTWTKHWLKYDCETTKVHISKIHMLWLATTNTNKTHCSAEGWP